MPRMYENPGIPAFVPGTVTGTHPPIPLLTDGTVRVRASRGSDRAADAPAASLLRSHPVNWSGVCCVPRPQGARDEAT
jgi:hypothetical protein